LGNKTSLMMKLTWTILFCLLLIEVSAQVNIDGLLRNGRAVTYYKMNGQLLRELEQEENEYQQWAIAKTVNIFKTVEIASYQRTDRQTPDMEDLYRSREEDQANLPIQFKCLLEYKPIQGTEAMESSRTAKDDKAVLDQSKVFILMDVNVRSWKIQAEQAFKAEIRDDLGKVWSSSMAQLKLPYGKGLYRGPITIISVGKTSSLTKTADGWTINGQFAPAAMCSISNFVVVIAAAPERALQIMETMDKDKMAEALRFHAKWP
jgi:hypothetical protein